MANKVYKVTEQQLGSITNKLKNKETLVDEGSNSTGDRDNVFEIELKRSDIDVTFSDDLFKMYMVTGNLSHDGIMVNGLAYDIDYNLYSIKAKYEIEVQYTSYGIYGVVFHPIACTIIGELTINGDDDSYDKDFEITYNNHGLVENSFSGEMRLGENSIVIPKLSSNIEMISKYVASHNDNEYFTGIFAKNIEAMISGEGGVSKILMEY